MRRSHPTPGARLPASLTGGALLAPHLRALTSIRFLFAAAVVVFHFRHYLVEAGAVSYGSVGYNLLHTGYLGVQFFFVLSGFILAYTYLQWRGEGFRKAFWVARFARIYPTYLLGALLILPFVVSSSIRTNGTAAAFASNALMQVTLTQAWIPEAALGWNSPGWSLSVEAFFYLLFPALLPRLAGLRTRTLVALSCGAFAVSQLIALAGGLAPGAISQIDATNPPIAPWALFFSSLPLFRLPEFLIGMAAGIVFTRHGRALERHANALVFTSIAIVLVTAGVFAPGIPVLHLNNGGLSLPAAALFIGLAAGSGWVARALAHPVLVRLGEASYAVYILHYPIALWMSRVLSQQDGLRTKPLALLAIHLVVIVLASLAAYSVVEEPMRKWIKARFGKQAESPASAATPPRPRSSPARS